jgi:MFS family permease
LIAAISNSALLVAPEEMTALLILRFVTGFFLAGIYSVGMKIVASWYDQGLGRALGYLVGALVLGTAFPHLIRSLGAEIPWQQVILGVSLIAVSGGIVNSIGFLVTVVSIQLTASLLLIVGVQYIFWLLILGPILGWFALRSIREDASLTD